MSSAFGGIGFVLLIIVISICVMLLLREFWSWYFKTNIIITNQEESLKTQKEIQKLLEAIEKNISINSTFDSFGRKAVPLLNQKTQDDKE